MTDPESLGALQSRISATIPTLGRPNGYGHNIISLCLLSIAENYGTDTANEAIRDFGLDKKGWIEE